MVVVAPTNFELPILILKSGGHDFFREKTFTLHTFISCSIFEERWQE